MRIFPKFVVLAIGFDAFEKVKSKSDVFHRLTEISIFLKYFSPMDPVGLSHVHISNVLMHGTGDKLSEGDLVWQVCAGKPFEVGPGLADMLFLAKSLGGFACTTLLIVFVF